MHLFWPMTLVTINRDRTRPQTRTRGETRDLSTAWRRRRTARSVSTGTRLNSPRSRRRDSPSRAHKNYGIIGNGAQIIGDVDPVSGEFIEVCRFHTQDGLYDCAWSEGHENVIVSACGDGSVKVWDGRRTSREPAEESARARARGVRDVVEFSGGEGYVFNRIVGRYHQTMEHRSRRELANVRRARILRLRRCRGVRSITPTCSRAPRGLPELKIWDLRQPHATLSVPVHDYEALCCDWNKWNDCVVATGAVDKSVRLWDRGNPSRELQTLVGHDYAVRRVKCSPHAENIVYTCSYDMTVGMWDWKSMTPLLKRRITPKFAVGLDTSCLIEGLIASCGWDEMMHAWNTVDGSPPPAQVIPRSGLGVEDPPPAPTTLGRGPVPPRVSGIG